MAMSISLFQRRMVIRVCVRYVSKECWSIIERATGMHIQKETISLIKCSWIIIIIIIIIIISSSISLRRVNNKRVSISLINNSRVNLLKRSRLKVAMSWVEIFQVLNCNFRRQSRRKVVLLLLVKGWMRKRSIIISLIRC